MKIALLASPYLSVPPHGYGGTEKIVSYLADGLVTRGHEVTLFATGDSKTKARLVSVFPEAIGNSGYLKNDPIAPLTHYRECFVRAGEFDLIHSHAQYLGLFFSELVTTPVLHTWHGSYHPGEGPEIRRQLLRTMLGQSYISISDSQRAGLPDLHYVATVYNGIDIDAYPFVENPSADYLLWVGRVVEKKGPRQAIEVAKILGMRLVMAATIDPIEKEYFDREIKPHIDGKHIQFFGELDAHTLSSLYGNALCTLYPISWHEPFGLVMVESMASGTPVVAYDMGSVPEIIRDGQTGFVVSSDVGVAGLVSAVRRIREIDRHVCRRRVLSLFTKEHMVEAYEKVYQETLLSV